MNVVIVNCFDTYEQRVDLIHSYLCRNGHFVRVLTSDYRHFEKKKRIETKKDYVFFSAKPYKKNLSIGRLMSHRSISRDIFTYLDSHDEVDILWVLVPPNSFVKDAALFKQKHKNVKLIFDLIDLWPETMPVSFIKKLFPFTIWKNLRDKNLKYADYVVTECMLYQDRLKTLLKGLNTDTIYLARPLIQYKSISILPNDRICFCYLGSINNIIDINMIAEIIRHYIKLKPVDFHVVGDGEQKDELLKITKETGATVFFHGKVYDREAKQRIFDACHYGLNIMKKSVCVGLTMKSMDYMEFGLPIINNIQGDTWTIIEKYKIGINIDSLLLLPDDYDFDCRARTRSFFENNMTIDIFEKKISKIINEEF